MVSILMAVLPSMKAIPTVVITTTTIVASALVLTT
jgi:hypothetical protein